MMVTDPLGRMNLKIWRRQLRRKLKGKNKMAALLSGNLVRGVAVSSFLIIGDF
jgi:hypothetical protein